MPKRIVIQKPCLLRVIVPHGQIEDRQIRPVSPRCNRCSHWPAGWDMRCVLLPDKQILLPDKQIQRQQQGNQPFADQKRGFRSQTRTGRDYSKVKCFSCGQFGHMQSRCPRPDASLPFKPAGWFLQSDSRQQRDGDNQPGNSP